MRLEVGSFPVRDVVLGDETRLNGDVLEIDQQELIDGISKDR